MPPLRGLDGWQAWCQTCGAHRVVNCMKQRDQANGEVYYDYVCSECFSIVLNIHRTNPEEREKQPPMTSLRLRTETTANRTNTPVEDALFASYPSQRLRQPPLRRVPSPGHAAFFALDGRSPFSRLDVK
jgi:hypothetical protein